MKMAEFPKGTVERAMSDAANALVPMAHALEHGLDWPNAKALAEEKLQDLADLGGRIEWFDSEDEGFAHLAEAAHYVWGA